MRKASVSQLKATLRVCLAWVCAYDPPVVLGYFCPPPANVKSAWGGITSRTEKYGLRQENMSG